MKSTSSRFELYAKNGDKLAAKYARGTENNGRKNLIGAKLCGIEIGRGYLQQCDFTLGEFDESRIFDLIVDDSEFEGTMFEDALFSNCSFRNSLMYSVLTLDARFVSCNFENMKFLGCNLSLTEFADCRFTDVFFGSDNTNHHTSLIDTNFATSQFENVKFAGAKFDNQTAFPPTLITSLVDGLYEKKSLTNASLVTRGRVWPTGPAC